jgi:hypothetical protein
MTAAHATRPRSGFSPLVMLAIILVGVFSFAAFVTLSAFAPELSTGRDGRAHALSHSAVGFAGAVQLAGAAGHEVYVGRQTHDDLRFQSLVVLTPEFQLTSDEFYNAWGATTLIVAPKWAAGPDPQHRGWVVRLAALDPAMVSEMLSEVAPGIKLTQTEGSSRPTIQGQSVGAIEQLQTLSGDSVTPIVVDDAGRTILARLNRDDGAHVYVLSDPDFLNTHGLADRGRARIGMSILETLSEPGQTIVFDVTLNGLGADRGILRMAFEPPFLGATIAMALAAGLLGWRAAARAGPAAPTRRAIALGKAALADNAAALLRLTGRERRLAPGYVRVVALQLVEELSGARRDESEAVAWLDRLAAAHRLPVPFSVLAREASEARTPMQMLEAAQKLHAWKQEIRRATR